MKPVKSLVSVELFTKVHKNEAHIFTLKYQCLTTYFWQMIIQNATFIFKYESQDTRYGKSQ